MLSRSIGSTVIPGFPAAIWLALAAALAVVSLWGGSLKSAVLQNAALVGLLQPWLAQASWPLAAPCQKTAGFREVGVLFQQAAAGSKSVRLRTHLGRLSWVRGACDEAISHWQQAMQDGDALAGFELARVGREDIVTRDLGLILAERAYAYAISRASLGDAQSAQRWFEHAFALAPQHRSAMALAIQYERTGIFTRIRTLWQDMADRLSQSDPDYWWAIAKFSEQDNDWAAAGLSYERGARLSPDPYDFWLQAGRAWEKTPEWDKAVQAYQNAADATSYPVFAHLGLGFGYSARNDYAQALRYLRLAQQAAPDYYRSYYYMGITYYRMREYENARDSLELALERSPDDGSVIYMLARTLYDMGQAEEAEKRLVQAIDAVNPPPPAWWVQLGDWRLAQGRCADAARAYSLARATGAEASVMQARSAVYAETCGKRLSFRAKPMGSH